MLAMIDTPEFMSDLQRRSQSLARQVNAGLAAHGSRQQIPVGENLCGRQNVHYAYVHNGAFKFTYCDSLVRIYGDTDLLATSAHADDQNSRIEASFSSDVTTFSRAAVSRALAESGSLRELWLEWTDLDGQLLRALSGLYARSEPPPKVGFRRLEDGETLLREGETCAQIYELVEGSAEVSVGGRAVGKLAAGEFVGEISFLTGRACNATVTANADCFLHAIDKSEFARLVHARPRTAIDLARGLAERVARLDAALAAGGGPSPEPGPAAPGAPR